MKTQLRTFCLLLVTLLTVSFIEKSHGKIARLPTQSRMASPGSNIPFPGYSMLQMNSGTDWTDAGRDSLSSLKTVLIPIYQT